MNNVSTIILLERDPSLRLVLKMVLEDKGYFVLDSASESGIWESFKQLEEGQRIECFICNSSRQSSLSPILKASAFRNSGKIPSVINIFDLSQDGLLDLDKFQQVIGDSVA